MMLAGRIRFMTRSVRTSRALSGRIFLRFMIMPQTAHKNMRPSRFNNSVNEAMVNLPVISIIEGAVA
jgi:hypothetical protein